MLLVILYLYLNKSVCESSTLWSYDAYTCFLLIYIHIYMKKYPVKNICELSSFSNRYQVLAGVIEQRFLEPLLHQHKLVLSALCFAVRTGNTYLGSLLWVPNFCYNSQWFFCLHNINCWDQNKSKSLKENFK